MQLDLRPPPAGAAAGEKGYAGVASRGGAIVSLSASGRLGLVRPGRGFERWTDALTGGASAPAAVAVSPLHLAAGGAKGVVRLFDPSTLAYTGALPRPAVRGKLAVRSPEEARALAADASSSGTFPDVVALRRELRRRCNRRCPHVVCARTQRLGAPETCRYLRFSRPVCGIPPVAAGSTQPARGLQSATRTVPSTCGQPTRRRRASARPLKRSPTAGHPSESV